MTDQQVRLTVAQACKFQALQAVLDGRMTNQEAADALGLSLRQVQRLKPKVRRHGPAGVLHGNAGRAPSNKLSAARRQKILHLATTLYAEYNFSHLAETLAAKQGRPIPPTAFQIAMQTLGIHLIFANSPQARGRAERLNGSLQNRLVAELVRYGLHDCPRASRYLNQVFIPRYARRFGQTPADSSPAWRLLDPAVDLPSILCVKDARTVANDNTIRFRRRCLPDRTSPRAAPPRPCDHRSPATLRSERSPYPSPLR